MVCKCKFNLCLGMNIKAMVDKGLDTHQHCKTFINMDLEADLGQTLRAYLAV